MPVLIPSLARISPNFVTLGSPSFTLTATGSGFQSTSVINWGAVPLVTTYVSPTVITATVGSGLVATNTSVEITVSTPAVGTSSALTFYISFPLPDEEPTGLLYRELQNIRTVGVYPTVSEYAQVSAVLGLDGWYVPISPQDGSWLYRTIELPSTLGLPDSLPVGAAVKVEEMMYDPLTNTYSHYPTPRIWTAVSQVGEVVPPLASTQYILKSGTLDADDTFKFGYIRFSTWDAGKYIQITYHGRGSLVWSDDVKNVCKGLSLLPSTIRPGHISTIPSDDFLFPRDIYAIGNIHLNGDLICSKVVQANITEITTTDELLLLNSDAVTPATKVGIVFGRGGQDPAFEWIEADSAFEFSKKDGTLLFKIGNDSWLAMPNGGFNVHGFVNTDAYFTVNGGLAGQTGPSVQVATSAAAQAPELILASYSFAGGIASPGSITCLSVNGSPGSPLPVTNNDPLLEMNAAGWDGSDFTDGGRISFKATENWNSGAIGSLFKLSLGTKGMTELVTAITAVSESLSTTGNTFSGQEYVTNMGSGIEQVRPGYSVTGPGVPSDTTVRNVVTEPQGFNCSSHIGTFVLDGFSSTSTLIPGMFVDNPYIYPPGGAHIASIINTNSVLMDTAAIADSSGDKHFYLTTFPTPLPTDPGPSIFLDQNATATATGVSLKLSLGPRVGIGNITPSCKLDVDGRVNTRDRYTVNDGMPGLTGPSLQILGRHDGEGPIIGLFSYSDQCAIFGGKAQGSSVSPSNTSADDYLLQIVGGGFPDLAGTNPDLDRPGGVMAFQASENWDTTHHGTRWTLSLAPNLTGTTNLQDVIFAQALSDGPVVSINQSSPEVTAILQADSTTRGFLPPRMTNAQMVAITPGPTAEGLMVYDNTNHLYNYHNGTAWTIMGSGGGAGAGAPVQEDTIVLIGSSPQSVFPISTPLTVTSLVEVYVNGILQPTSSYTFSISPAQVTLSTPRTTGELVTILVYATGGSGGGTALNLATTGSPVDVSLSSPPSSGQILISTDSTHATWQTMPASNSLKTTTSPVVVGGAIAPSAGQVLTATSATAADWENPTSGPAPSLQTTTSPVVISGAAAPSTGQVLTALTATTASWQTPSGGGSPGGSAGAVQYNTGSGFGGDAAKFNWDESATRLGVGTGSPQGLLDARSTAGGDINTPVLLHLDADFSNSGDLHYVVNDGVTVPSNPLSPTCGPTISAAQSKFGGGSALFSGSQYCIIPNPLNLSGDYTIDFWANVATSDPTFDIMIADGWYSGANLAIFVDQSGLVNVYLNGASAIVSTTVIGSLPAGTVPSTANWHHVALVRSSGTMSLYVDGVQQGATPSDYATRFSGVGYFGWDTTAADADTHLTGYLDEIRISNIARWLTNFTPPTSAYSGIVSRGLMVSDAGSVVINDGNQALGKVLTSDAGGQSSWSYYYDKIDAIGPVGAGTTTVDWSLGLVSTVTLTASITIAFSNPVVGQVMTLFLKQGGSGSYTVTWPSMKWPSATPPTLTTTVGKTDIISIFWDGTDYWGSVGGQNY